MADWYSRTLAGRIPWHANFNTNAQATGTTYGLSAGDKTDIGNDNTNVPLIVNYKEAVEAFRQAVTEWANLMFDAPIGTALPVAPTAPTAPTLAIGSKPSIVPRTRLMAGVIKADADVTPEVLENYGIIAPDEGAPPDHPTLEGTPETSFGIRLTFSMHGYPKMEIQSKRAGETTYTYLATDTNSPYVDSRPPLVANTPEIRTFRARFVDNDDNPVGTWSNELSVTASP